MARPETYGDIACLEHWLHEHATTAALDDLGKLPAVRQQIWTLIRARRKWITTPGRPNARAA